MNNLLAGRAVLVVEDEMLVMMMIEDMLADLGCDDVTVAASVPQALALVAARDFDMATLDVNLGGVRSYPVADALAANGVPYLFSTGYDDHGMREGYRDRPVLKKPFHDAALAEIVEGLLAARSSRGPEAGAQAAGPSPSL